MMAMGSGLPGSSKAGISYYTGGIRPLSITFQRPFYFALSGEIQAAKRRRIAFFPHQ